MENVHVVHPVRIDTDRIGCAVCSMPHSKGLLMCAILYCICGADEIQTMQIVKRLFTWTTCRKAASPQRRDVCPPPGSLELSRRPEL
eukprot:6179320-Pleurochrysis_carterae.AAC.2